MAKVNTLFKKVYLLAGVMIAANMFAVTEVKAMEAGQSEQKKEETKKNGEKIKLKIKDFTKQENNEKKDKKGKISGPQSFCNFLLSHENAINLIGGVVSSVANNYLKLWDYNAGSYCNLRIGCLGWRTKKFFDIVQVGINLNLGRGILWLIPGIFGLMQCIKTREKEYPIILNSTAGLITLKILKKMKKEKNIASSAVFYSIIFLTQGFVSIPLTIHFSNFSISISFDSILWEFVIGSFLKETGQQPDKENQFYNNLMDIEKLQDTSDNKKDKEEKKEKDNENPGTAS